MIGGFGWGMEGKAGDALIGESSLNKRGVTSGDGSGSRTGTPG